MREAPAPTCKSELRSFLGLTNYYAKFLSNLSTTFSPLYHLIKKAVTWPWDKETITAFGKAKDMLSTSHVLVYYDLEKSLFLECDTSCRGIGAVLSQQLPNDSRWRVAFASRTNCKAEANYSQIVREGLALFFDVTRPRQYVYSRKFTLITDHKPLIHLFCQTASLPTMGSPRIR